MTPVKIEVDIDDTGVSARLIEGGEQKKSLFREQPMAAVQIAFMVRELLEKDT